MLQNEMNARQEVEKKLKERGELSQEATQKLIAECNELKKFKDEKLKEIESSNKIEIEELMNQLKQT